MLKKMVHAEIFWRGSYTRTGKCTRLPKYARDVEKNGTTRDVEIFWEDFFFGGGPESNNLVL